MSDLNSATELVQKYAVIAELGQGGMSIVHLAAARGLGNVQKLVVLKSIRPELMTNEKVRQMFMDEARLATRLTHPNIVQTYEVVMLGGRPVIVMEYMEGQSLSSVLRKASETGGLPLPVKLRILVESLAGLDYAHNLADYEGNVIGLVHRDVSPQNVFVTYEGHVKILDFGIAKAAGNSAHTEIGELKGKIRYMAPEQMQAVDNLDRRADVFSVGVMMWEALTGKRLWHGVADVEVLTSVMNEGVPAPSTINPDVDPTLEAICIKALERNRDKRYENCAQMQTDLEQAVETLGLRADSKETRRIVQELFGDVRMSIRRAIDRKLRGVDSLPPAAAGDESAFLQGESLLSTGSAGSISLSRSSPTITGHLPERSKPRKGWAVAAAIAALLVAGGSALALRGHTPEPQPNAVQSALPATASASASAAPRQGDTIEMHLSASPDQSKLYLDGKALASNPIALRLPLDSLKHELKAEADGFLSKTVALELTSTTDPTVSLSLEASDPARRTNGASSFRWTKPHPQVGASATSTAAAAPNCDHPFTIDAAGIRHVRQECM